MNVNKHDASPAGSESLTREAQIEAIRKPLLNLREAGWVVGLTPEGLRARLKRGQIPPGIAVRLGGRSLRFDRVALEAWARSNPVGGRS